MLIKLNMKGTVVQGSIQVELILFLLDIEIRYPSVLSAIKHHSINQ